MMYQIHYNRVQDQNMHEVSCNRTTLDQNILKVNFPKGPGQCLKHSHCNLLCMMAYIFLISLIVNNEQKDGPNPLSL